jgi:hypothetical protein
MSDLVGWRVASGVVQRWEEGSSVPLGDVVLACQEITASPVILEPSSDTDEVVTPYADRGMIARAQWNGTISDSSAHVWLYGMAEFGYAIDDQVPAIVQEAAGRGCSIRVLLLSPSYEAISDIDASEGSPPGTLHARILASLARFAEMRQACGGAMSVRTYDMHPTVSIVRGDDEMLVTPYLRYFMGSNSPTIGITAASAPKMFGRYERHFNRTWKLATEWTP